AMRSRRTPICRQRSEPSRTTPKAPARGSPECSSSRCRGAASVLQTSLPRAVHAREDQAKLLPTEGNSIGNRNLEVLEKARNSRAFRDGPERVERRDQRCGL